MSEWGSIQRKSPVERSSGGKKKGKATALTYVTIERPSNASNDATEFLQGVTIELNAHHLARGASGCQKSGRPAGCPLRGRARRLLRPPAALPFSAMRAGDSWRTDIKRPGFVAADGHPGAPPLAADEAGSGRTSRPPAFRYAPAATLFGSATGDSGDDASARSPNKAATTPKTTTPCRRSAQPSHGAAAPPPHSAPPVACFDNADPGGASGCLLECVAVRTTACVCVHGTSASRRRAEESSHVLTTARRRRRRASRRPRRYEQCTGAAAPSGVSALFGSAFACIPGCVPKVRAPCCWGGGGAELGWVVGGEGERRWSSPPM